MFFPDCSEYSDAVEKIVFDNLAEECFRTAQKSGFHTVVRGWPLLCALLHSEVSELFEAARDNMLASDHLPEHSAISEELADIMIRVFDTSREHGIDLYPVFRAKMEYNKSRPKLHGGKQW